MRKVPRDYQIAATSSLWDFVHTNQNQNPLVIMPTGTGKSLTMAMFIWSMVRSYPHLRIMNVTHVKELVQGNYKSLLEVWPAAPAGIYSAGLNQRNTRSQITFAGIMSVAKRAATFGRVDFLLIDEAHMVSDNESASYVKFISQLRLKNPNLIVVGFTATGFRSATGMLTDGQLFSEVAFDLSSGEAFLWMIQEGYLCRPVPIDPGFTLDDSGIGLSGGDYNNQQASDAMHQQGLIERAVETTISVAESDGRKACLTFAQSIADSELIAEMFTYKGYPVEPVHSKRDDRNEILEAFQRGDLWGVTNMSVLTTGYDQANIDLICSLRLTRSPGLWVQMVGRGTRPLFAPGYDITTKEGRLASILASPKQNCKVLDFTGNTERLGPINYPNIPKRRGSGGGELPTRTCPDCFEIVHISVKICPGCGHEFPLPDRVRNYASTGELVVNLDLTKQPEPVAKEYEIYTVHQMTCSHNKGKNGKKDTMRVYYRCGYHTYSNWVCFEHEHKSFPRRKAEKWWADHLKVKNQVCPSSVEEALEWSEDFLLPKFIKVWINTKFPEIVDFDFVGTRFVVSLSTNPVIHEPDRDPLSGFLSDAERRITDMMDDDDIPF